MLKYAKLYLTLALLCLASGARAQQPQLVQFNGFVPPAGFPFGPPTIAVCVNGGSGGPPCAPLTLIYTDGSGTRQQPNPFTIDPNGNGNFTFWAACGTNYALQSYGSGYTTTLTTITTTACSGGGGGSPTGPAGGDLTGSYPGPTVAKVNGGVIPTSKTVVGTNASGQIVDATTATLTNPIQVVHNPACVTITGATPAVSSGNCFVTGNGSATTITNFTGGVDSQTIDVNCGDTFTTIANGTNISTFSGGNLTCIVNQAYQFTFYNSLTKWVQVGGGGASTPAGATFDIQCNNSGSLGNCAGTAENLKGDVIPYGPNPIVDIRSQGARAVNPNVAPAVPGFTAACVATNPSVTISSAWPGANGDGVVLQGCGAASGMSTPSAPTVTASLAAAPPGTGVTVPAPAGGSETTCYVYADRDKGQGLTAKSGETCVTGQLRGVHALAISNSSITNNILTYTTATRSPEVLAVGMYVNIAGTSLDGIYGQNGAIVATIPSNTTFTIGPVASDTRNGVSGNATGGTLTYWNMNHVVPPAPGTNVWQHIYYAGATGAETFDGIGLPVNVNLNPDQSYQVWDDLGSPYTTAPQQPWYIPSTPPGVAIADSLVTTIASGAGSTTLTLTTAPTTSVASTPILYEFLQNIKSTFTVAQASHSSVYVPCSSAGSFLGNALTDFTSFFNVPISVCGQLYLTDTPIWQGVVTGQINRGLLTTPQFAYAGYTPVQCVGAYPCMMMTAGGWIEGFNLNNSGNQFNSFYLSGGAIPTLLMQNMAFNGSGASSYSDVNFIAFGRGQAGGNPAGLIFNNILMNAHQGNSATPQWQIKNFGEINFHCVMGSGRGIYIGQAGTGTNVDYDGCLEMQAMSTPFFTAYAPNSAININIANTIEDTGNMPFVAALSNGITANISSSGGIGGGIPQTTGIALYRVTGYQNTVNGEAVSFGVLNDGTFNAPIQAERVENMHVALGQGYSFFSGSSAPPAPTCTVVTATPVSPAGTFTFMYAVTFPNGGQSVVSAPSTSCTANGTTQQIQISGSTVFGATGAYQWWLGNNNLPTLNTSGCPGVVYPTTQTWNWTGVTCAFSTPPNVPGGGPAGFRNGFAWDQTGLVGQYTDYTGSASAPANPSAGNCRQYYNTTTGQISWINSTGAACGLAGGGPGTGTPNAVTDWLTSTTLGSIPGPITNQVLTAINNAAPSFQSPGLPDGNGGAGVTTTPYLIQCDSSTSLLDRASLLPFKPGSSVGTFPLSTNAGCGGNFVFGAANQNAGNLTFNRTSPDVFNVYTGNTASIGVTNFILTNGQYFTANQGTAGIWEVRITTSGGVNAASPITASVYISPNCPPTSTTAPCIFTKADTLVESNCSWSTSSPTITCPSANFTSTANTGQIAFGYSNGTTSCNPDFQANPFGGEITTTHATISSIGSATTLNLGANPANAATNACFYHGTPDDTAFAAVDTFLSTAAPCPRIELAAANYMLTTFHFLTNPPGCVNLPTQYPNQSLQGNIVLANGEDMECRGPGACVLAMPPDFPESGSCVNGVNGDACWAMPLLAHWSGFSFTGGGNLSIPAGKALLSEDVGQLDYFSCYNMGMSAASSVGLELSHWARGTNVNLARCGQSNVHAESSLIGSFFRLFGEVGSIAGSTNLGNNLTLSGGLLVCYDCEFYGTFDPLTTPISVVITGGSSFTCHFCDFSAFAGTNPVGIRYIGSSGNTLVELTGLGFSNPNSITTFYSMQNTMSGGTLTVKLDNVLLTHGSSGFSIADNNTGGTATYIFDNMSRLDPTGFAFVTANPPIIIAPGHMVTAACTGTASASSTLGLRISGTSTTGTGLTSACTSTTLDAGHIIEQATTLSTLRCTSSATTVSVACTVMLSHNGGAFASTGITCTMAAATACNDITHTAAAATGDLVTVQIVTGAAETGANVKAQVLWQP